MIFGPCSIAKVSRIQARQPLHLKAILLWQRTQQQPRGNHPHLCLNMDKDWVLIPNLGIIDVRMPNSKRFLELCVNTGEFQCQLAEIDISDVKDDGQLFCNIQERYVAARSFRVKYFFIKPIDIHFVQFSLEDRYRVGILDKPMAIPCEAEMAAEGYGYHPCPLKPPPFPANIFLHHLSRQTGHRRLIWGNRIPQKLHQSILQGGGGGGNGGVPNDLVLGWGVHIIEGLNKVTILFAMLGAALVSGVMSVAWVVVRDDVQGGFAIGAWLTDLRGIIVILVATKWSEL
ncbi:hypothetical protein B0H63DRAFT_511578 [Podospora didyma]|uniref:Uncharacterized protein n=1 Tax=Podospora didyma TaxID=330526 RepID=A0AAE0NI12_9PEZI|nr:hypothetical protein B0H63DRAFT_511578 [Podospora didyma]